MGKDERGLTCTFEDCTRPAAFAIHLANDPDGKYCEKHAKKRTAMWLNMGFDAPPFMRMSDGTFCRFKDCTWSVTNQGGQEAVIEKILTEFDFEVARRALAESGKAWTLEALRKEARELLEHVFDGATSAMHYGLQAVRARAQEPQKGQRIFTVELQCIPEFTGQVVCMVNRGQLAAAKKSRR